METRRETRKVLKPTGEIIRARRKELKITQVEFAKLIGKSQRSIKKYESGEIDIPLSVLTQICEVLDLELMFIRGR